MLDRLIQHYPVLQALAVADVQTSLRDEAQLVQVPAGTVLFEEGKPCRGFPMVLDGAVRVARGSPGGRTLELYRVTPGELCVVSTSCLFGQTPLTAHGQTLASTELVLLSPAGFDRWVRHEPFRRFVFGIFADRIADLMALAEAVAFQRLDQRLASTLLGALALVAATADAQNAFVHWESPHVHPLELSADGTRLVAVNTADHRLEVYAIGGDRLPAYLRSIPVGLDPVSVRLRGNSEAWVDV